MKNIKNNHEGLALLLVEGNNQKNNMINPGVIVPKIDEKESLLVPIYVTSANLSDSKSRKNDLVLI